MKNEIVTACYQLVTAGINGTVQGIALTLLVAVGLRLLGRTNAATRHAVWFGTLLLLALLIPAHILRERLDSARNAVVVQEAESASPDAILTAAALMPREQNDDDSTGDAVLESRDFGSSSEGRYASLHAVWSDTRTPRSEVPEHLSDLTALDAAVVNQVEANNGSRVFAGLSHKIRSAGERLLSPVSWKLAAELPLPLAVAICLLWMVMAGGKMLLLFRQLFRIRRLKRDSGPPSPELSALLYSLRAGLGVRRRVMLRVSREHRSAVVLGFFRPVILLPVNTGVGEAEHVLRHELAHVCRRDDWTNLVQQFIGAAFFFHPAIWWISRRISLEREIACDDQVLQSTGRPKTYALLLADLAGRLQPTVLAPGVSTNQSQLKQRIDMILNPNRNTSSRLGKARLGLLATMAGVVAAVAIYSAPRLVFAQTVAAPAPPTPDIPAPVSEDTVPAPLPAPIEVAASVSADISLAASPLPPEPPVGPGPRFKPGAAIPVNPPTFTPQGPVAVHPAPGLPPVPVAPGATPVPELAPVTPAPRAFVIAGADRAPAPGQPPRPARRDRDESLESRLDRLEKMVQSLLDQQKNKFGQFEYHMKDFPKEWTFDRKNDGAQNFSYRWELKQPEMQKKQAELGKRRAELDKNMAELQRQHSALDPKEKAKLKEFAEQQAKMAVDQAKIAREAERASREQLQRRPKVSRDGARNELEALHRQRETLERQMDKLDRQIEKLEQDQERSEDEQGAEQEDPSNEQPERSSDHNGNSNDNHNSNNQPAAR